MKRKPGALLPIEISILDAGLRLSSRGIDEFYGFLVAKEIKDSKNARLLTAHGTLYKALDRLEQMGFLTSQWEDPQIDAMESRPRRRLYRGTAAGGKELAKVPPPNVGTEVVIA